MTSTMSRPFGAGWVKDWFSLRNDFGETSTHGTEKALEEGTTRDYYFRKGRDLFKQGVRNSGTVHRRTFGLSEENAAGLMEGWNWQRKWETFKCRK